MRVGKLLLRPRKLGRLLAVALVASGALGCDSGTSAEDIGPNGESLTLAVIGISTDLVSKADQGLSPDGEPDGHFAATAVGSFDAFILVTTSDGHPTVGQQWDTLTQQDPVPPFGFAYTTGETTWVLAVVEDGRIVNDAAGRVSLGKATHVLELVAADSGYFMPGVEFRLYGRTNGTWIQSNVVFWPR